MGDTVPEMPKTLTEKFKEENITPFAILSMLMGTGLIAYVLFVARTGAMGYVGVVGVGSAAMWMPYLMALIYYNTDKGKPMSGLIKKLGYADLPAPYPALRLPPGSLQPEVPGRGMASQPRWADAPLSST